MLAPCWLRALTLISRFGKAGPSQAAVEADAAQVLARSERRLRPTRRPAGCPRRLHLRTNRSLPARRLPAALPPAATAAQSAFSPLPPLVRHGGLVCALEVGVAHLDSVAPHRPIRMFAQATARRTAGRGSTQPTARATHAVLQWAAACAPAACSPAAAPRRPPWRWIESRRSWRTQHAPAGCPRGPSTRPQASRKSA